MADPVTTQITTEAWLDDPEGIRIEPLDELTEYEYVKIANQVGVCKIKLPAKFSKRKLKLDAITEIWQGYGPGTLKMDFCGFLRAWNLGDDAGLDYYDLYSLSLMHLLKRRCVMNLSGSAQADKTDYADDMLKEVVKEQLGSSAGTGRNLTSVGGGFTIENDLAKGPSVSKAFAHKKVFDTATEIVQSSNELGTKLYFDIEPIITEIATGKLGLFFRTYTGQRGDNRTVESGIANPVFIGKEWGNFSNGLLEIDYQDEENFIRVLGQGKGTDREYVERSNASRIGKSIWNRCEGTRDARDVEIGDTTTLNSEGDAALDEMAPKFRLSGDVIETPTFRYGIEWNFGDLVTVTYKGIQMSGMIDIVVVKKTPSSPRRVTARINISGNLTAGGYSS